MSSGKKGSAWKHIPLAAVFALIATGTPAREKMHAPAKPPETALIIPRPETVRMRNATGKRFPPAVPQCGVSFQKHPLELITVQTCEGTPIITTDAGSTEIMGPDEGGFAPLFQPAETGVRFSRCSDSRVSLREELITLDDLDYGKYGALAAPGDFSKRDFKGFLHIPIVWTEQNRFYPYFYLYGREGWKTIRLAEGMNRFTNIRTSVDKHLYLSSARIFQRPFLFITADAAFELTRTERRNLGEYLRSGGFVFADNGTPQYEKSAAEASLKQMFRDVLGCHARFEPIPNNHPLYHCFFDFDNPPPGAEISIQNVGFQPGAGYDPNKIRLLKPVFFLEGVFLENRLVAVYSDKGYGEKWGQPFRQYQIDGQPLWERHNTPQIKMGVNLVVYALTREGGMTERNMAGYRDIQN